MSSVGKIALNLRNIRARVAAAATAAGRDPEGIVLIAVTKSVGVAEIQALLDLGVRHFGENRVDVARAKRDALANPAIVWHMIGNIQRRKTKEVLDVFDRIDSVDRLALAESLQVRCTEVDTHAEVLVEVNISGEAQKHGVAPEELGEMLAAIQGMDRLRVRGLLTMAPYSAPPDEIRGIFGQLAHLAAAFDLRDVSMGMSNDFELAIAAGATEIRVGSALFE